CQAGSSAEFVASPGDKLTGRVVTGEASTVHGGKKDVPTSIKAPRVFEWGLNAATLAVEGLSDIQVLPFHDWTRPVTEPQGLGQLVVNDPKSGAPSRLNVARYY